MAFLWHLSGNFVDAKEIVITAGSRHGKFFLFIDPYPWEFEIRPVNIEAAVKWALNEGWTTDKGPNRNMAFSAKKRNFIWLPDGKKFLHDVE